MQGDVASPLAAATVRRAGDRLRRLEPPARTRCGPLRVPLRRYDCPMSAETDLIGERRRPPPGELTYEEFLAWCDEDAWAEWVDGQVILLPVTVAERHAAILSLLITLFKLATRFGRLGAVYAEPFQMRLRAARRGR